MIVGNIHWYRIHDWVSFFIFLFSFPLFLHLPPPPLLASITPLCHLQLILILLFVFLFHPLPSLTSIITFLFVVIPPCHWHSSTSSMCLHVNAPKPPPLHRYIASFSFSLLLPLIYQKLHWSGWRICHQIFDIISNYNDKLLTKMFTDNKIWNSVTKYANDF